MTKFKIQKRKLTSSRLLYIICLLPYLEPSVVTGTVDTFFNFGKVLSFGICIWLVVKHKEKRKRCNYILYISFFYVAYIGSTILNDGQVYRAFIDSITVIGFCLVICVYGFSKDSLLFFQVGYDLYTLLIFVNIISMLIYYGGITGMDVYFLGHDDTFIFWAIEYLLLAYMYEEFRSKQDKKPFYLAIALTGVTYIISQSASGIITIGMFVLFFNTISKNKRATKITNIIILVSNVGLVIFRVQKYFSFIIENIFHKNIGLTGRDKIWDRVLYLVYQKPITGYGYETSKTILSKFMLTDGSYFQFAHTHNFLLQIMYTMGIIGVIIFLVLYFISWKQMYISGENRWNRIVSSSLLASMVALLVNSYLQPTALFMLLIYGYEITKIEGITNEIRKNKKH